MPCWLAEHAIHRNLGVACTALGVAQFSALVLRPAQDAGRLRLAWELGHAWVGRAAAVVAIANIYWGTIHMWDVGAWPWATYTAWLGVVVGVAVGRDVQAVLRCERKPAACAASAAAVCFGRAARWCARRCPIHRRRRALRLPARGDCVVLQGAQAGRGVAHRRSAPVRHADGQEQVALWQRRRGGGGGRRPGSELQGRQHQGVAGWWTDQFFSVFPKSRHFSLP